MCYVNSRRNVVRGIIHMCDVYDMCVMYVDTVYTPGRFCSVTAISSDFEFKECLSCVFFL